MENTLTKVNNSSTSYFKKHLFICLSTYMRPDYLKSFLDSFLSTKSSTIDHTLIIASDGCAESDRENLINQIKTFPFPTILMFNNSIGICSQTNHLMLATLLLNAEYVVKFDDDVILHKDWDITLLKILSETPVKHIVVHDSLWTPAKAKPTDYPNLVSYVSYDKSQGAFYTWTREVLEKVGYCDSHEFLIRGHYHWDYTNRCCKAGYNKADNLYAPSGRLMTLIPRKNYIPTCDMTKVYSFITPFEDNRRKNLIKSPKRSLYIPFNTQATGKSFIIGNCKDKLDLLSTHWLFSLDDVVRNINVSMINPYLLDQNNKNNCDPYHICESILQSICETCQICEISETSKTSETSESSKTSEDYLWHKNSQNFTLDPIVSRYIDLLCNKPALSKS